MSFNPYENDPMNEMYLNDQDQMGNPDSILGSEIGLEEGSEKLDDGEDQSQRQKHKRRSKNDLRGRDYQCGCGKRYLSYPALYTHIKTKHHGQNPKGTNAPQCQTGRGRGRPRKSNIAIAPTNPVPQTSLNPSDPTGSGVKPNTQEAFQKHEEEKKPIQVYNIDEGLKKLNALEGEKFEPSMLIENFFRQIPDSKIGDYLWLQKYIRIISDQDEERKDEMDLPKKTCERIFCEYVYDIGKKVNERFFNILVIFVNSYRDCMNEYAWEILRKYKQVTYDERRRSFVSNNDAEQVPDIANDFIRYFLPKEYPNFDRSLAIDLTVNLCEWLKKNQYTRACISTI